MGRGEAIISCTPAWLKLPGALLLTGDPELPGNSRAEGQGHLGRESREWDSRGARNSGCPDLSQRLSESSQPALTPGAEEGGYLLLLGELGWPSHPGVRKSLWDERPRDCQHVTRSLIMNLNLQAHFRRQPRALPVGRVCVLFHPEKVLSPLKSGGC